LVIFHGPLALRLFGDSPHSLDWEWAQGGPKSFTLKKLGRSKRAPPHGGNHVPNTLAWNNMKLRLWHTFHVGFQCRGASEVILLAVTGSIGKVGGIDIVSSEVKFLDRQKIDHGEGICQGLPR